EQPVRRAVWTDERIGGGDADLEPPVRRIEAHARSQHATRSRMARDWKIVEPDPAACPGRKRVDLAGHDTGSRAGEVLREVGGDERAPEALPGDAREPPVERAWAKDGVALEIEDGLAGRSEAQDVGFEGHRLARLGEADAAIPQDERDLEGGGECEQGGEKAA